MLLACLACGLASPPLSTSTPAPTPAPTTPASSTSAALSASPTVVPPPSSSSSCSSSSEPTTQTRTATREERDDEWDGAGAEEGTRVVGGTRREVHEQAMLAGEADRLGVRCLDEYGAITERAKGGEGEACRVLGMMLQHKVMASCRAMGMGQEQMLRLSPFHPPSHSHPHSHPHPPSPPPPPSFRTKDEEAGGSGGQTGRAGQAGCQARTFLSPVAHRM